MLQVVCGPEGALTQLCVSRQQEGVSHKAQTTPPVQVPATQERTDEPPC